MDHFMIPSTITLAKLESISYDELAQLAVKYPSFDFTANPEDNDPEMSIKEMLPRYQYLGQEYPKEDGERDRMSLRVVDFAQTYDYTQTHYCQMFTYYAMIDRILTLEYFMTKMTSNLLDSLKLEHCIHNGLPFWSVDPE